MKQHNPKLIYATASGYGPEGPESGDPSFDQLGLARSGIMLAAGEPDMPPLAIAGGIADQMGAIMLAYGVMTALLARERFGIGQEVDASHLGSMMALQGLSVSARLMWGFAIPRMPRKYQANPLWNHYQCKDGRWICLGMLQPDRYWEDFCRAVGRPELATDERFADMRARAGNAGAAIEILDGVFAEQAARRMDAAAARRRRLHLLPGQRGRRSAQRPAGEGQRLRDRLRSPALRHNAGDGHSGAPARDARQRQRGLPPSSASTPRRS